MFNKLIMAGVFVGVLASVPIVLERAREGADAVPAEGQDTSDLRLALARPDPAAPRTEVLMGRKVRLASDARGHFYADFRINGRSVPAMIDTGASVVAINRSTARRLGIKLASTDFEHSVETANGKVMAAAATLERIEIGRIEVRDVQAVVLEDKALAGTLVGMTFLGKLRRYAVEGGALVLEQ